MTTSADFSTEEWETIVGTPPMVAMMTMAASPGGLYREMFAHAQAIVDAQQLFASSPFMQSLFSSHAATSLDKRSTDLARKSFDEIRSETLAQCRSVIALLAPKVSVEDLDHYKQYLYHVSDKVANAVSEGGFLGFGGKPVSEAEQTLLNDLTALLGIQPS